MNSTMRAAKANLSPVGYCLWLDGYKAGKKAPKIRRDKHGRFLTRRRKRS